MSDSDETVCDNNEYANEIPEPDTQVSPSILSGAIPRSNSMSCQENDVDTVQQAGNTPLSPEILPPSAKLKRTEAPNSCGVNNISVASTRSAPKDSCVSHQASKLKSIKAQEITAEELLIFLERKNVTGADQKKCPIFIEVKTLLATVHLQLAEFSQSQQQEREELVACQPTGSSSGQENPGSSWNRTAKQRLLELAERQRELLKLFQKHKELVGRLQSLRQTEKVHKRHVLPCVEKHHKSSAVTCGGSTDSPHNIPAVVSSISYCSANPEPGLISTNDNRMPKAISATSALQPASKSTDTLEPQGPDVQLIPSRIAGGAQSNGPQSAFQQVVLTGGQLYQIGGQVYYFPKGTAPTSALMTQKFTVQTTSITEGVSAPKQLNATCTQALTTTAAGMSQAVVGLTRTLAAPVMSVIRQPSLLAEQNLTQTASHNFTQTPQLRSTSSRHCTLSVSSQPEARQVTRGTHTDTQVVYSGCKTVTSLVANACSTIPGLRTAQQPANKTTMQASVPGANSVVVSAGSTRTNTFVRRNSFQSDLPDLKTLLDHRVIKAGPNVLSIQCEGRRFEASLKVNGFIESTGGETFHTPMAWLKAVTGSKGTGKQAQAYRMIFYKGKPLTTYSIPQVARGATTHETNKTCTTALNSFSESQFSQGNIPGGSQQQPSNEQSQTQQNIGGSQLISCPDDLTKLLENCCVVPISDQEFVPSDTLLPPDFWESNSEAKLPMSLIRELDF